MARITLVLNDKLVKKLREIQAKQLVNSPKGVSFSSVVNEAVAKALGVKLS